MTAPTDYTLMARYGARPVRFDWTATIPDLGWIDLETSVEVLVWIEGGELQWRLSHISTVGVTPPAAWWREQPDFRGKVFRFAEEFLSRDTRVNGFCAEVAERAAEEGVRQGAAA